MYNNYRLTNVILKKQKNNTLEYKTGHYSFCGALKGHYKGCTRRAINKNDAERRRGDLLWPPGEEFHSDGWWLFRTAGVNCVACGLRKNSPLHNFILQKKTKCLFLK